jgi:hypothetical protein
MNIAVQRGIDESSCVLYAMRRLVLWGWMPHEPEIQGLSGLQNKARWGISNTIQKDSVLANLGPI